MTEALREASRKVLDFFDGDEDKCALWWATSNPLLGGARPLDMVNQGRVEKLTRWIDQQLEGNLP